MRYKGKVYRPPSEAYSLIVQVTYGCSHNGCAFCDMYDDKHFAIRPMEEVREDFEMARRVYKKVERVFLADGDALMRKTEELSQIPGPDLRSVPGVPAGDVLRLAHQSPDQKRGGLAPAAVSGPDHGVYGAGVRL
ncbi:MAG: hypothetical protein V8S77_05440 [Oscillospiraceae bacterium]